MQSGRAVEGAQVVRRTILILQVLARGPNDSRAGEMSLREIAEQAGLNKATVHRVLAALEENGLVARGRTPGAYALGPALYALGQAAASRFSFRDLAEPACARLCAATEDTVYLSIRSGFDSICVARYEGSYPIKTLTLAVGSTRPLGVGAGSLALLAALPDEEVEEVIAGVEARLSPYPRFSAVFLRELVRDARAQGYALNDQNVVEGMSAVGIAVRHQAGALLGALSIAAVSARMGRERRQELHALLDAESRKISERLEELESSLLPRRVR